MKSEKVFFLWLTGVLVFIVFAAIMSARVQPKIIRTDDIRNYFEPKIHPNKYDEATIDEDVTESMCELSGGTWDACGTNTGCRLNPDQPCSQVCYPRCECVLDVECPDGYMCGNEIDGKGVCKIKPNLHESNS